jgi:hypothetical protein
MPDGIKAHIQNHTVPPDAKRFQVLSFDGKKTRDQVEEILSKNGVRADQVQLIPMNQWAPGSEEPTATWEVQMKDSQTPLNMPATNVYVWEQEGHIVRVETNGKKGDAG